MVRAVLGGEGTVSLSAQWLSDHAPENPQQREKSRTKVPERTWTYSTQNCFCHPPSPSLHHSLAILFTNSVADILEASMLFIFSQNYVLHLPSIHLNTEDITLRKNRISLNQSVNFSICLSIYLQVLNTHTSAITGTNLRCHENPVDNLDPWLRHSVCRGSGATTPRNLGATHPSSPLVQNKSLL